MIGVQQSLVIIKPDGIAKGLVGQILRSFASRGLSVIDHARLRLDRDWVERLYETEQEEGYFSDVVEWVSSAPVLMLKIAGPDAIDRVKWDIIGRYPHGIRGQYAEDWIKNVCHAPDTQAAARRELRLADEIFIKYNVMEQKKLNKKMIFALTGMSESGKSTVGRFLDSLGVPRLKIGRLFEGVRDKWAPESDLHEFVKKEEKKDPYALWDAFIAELILTMEDLDRMTVSIESLYGGGLGPYLKRKLGKHFCIIYVDIPQEVRLIRQMQREGLADIEEAKRYLLPRDEVKTASGIPQLKEISDEIIDNSGSMEELCNDVRSIVNNRAFSIDHKS